MNFVLEILMGLLSSTLLWVVMIVGYTAAGLYALQWVVTIPSRRREHARQLLHILELAIADGRPPEDVIREACATRDNTLPVRLHLLACLVEGGVSLPDALERVPSLLPRDIRAMLRVGLLTGRLDAVLPAARRALDESSNPQHAGGGLLLMQLLVSTTLAGAVLTMVRIWVLPKYRMIAVDLLGSEAPLPPLSELVLDHASVLVVVVLALVPILLALLFSRLAGPVLRFARLDGLRLLIPWHRHRAHRSFASILALQLDAGIAESDAVRNAAAATGLDRLRRKGEAAARALAGGVPLDRAIAEVDSRPGFVWRLRNALARPGMATMAVRAWVSELDDRATRLETMAAQAFFALLQLTCAVAVGTAVCGLFLSLVTIIERVLEQ